MAPVVQTGLSRTSQLALDGLVRLNVQDNNLHIKGMQLAVAQPPASRHMLRVQHLCVEASICMFAPVLSYQGHTLNDGRGKRHSSGVSAYSTCRAIILS